MPPCHFSEDEYECLLLEDLRWVHGRGMPHFKPSRRLENRLGYDLAVDTDYWRGHGRFNLQDPRLLSLYPVQVRALIPNRYVSALIQCKVPYHVAQRNQRTIGMWSHWGGPFYKWPINVAQATNLEGVEQTLQGIGVVKYAAPCFHTHGQMEAYSASGSVVDRSHFRSPRGLFRHSTYTYVSPHRGHAFSEPERFDAGSLLREVHDLLIKAEPISFARHLALVWDGLHQNDFLWDELAVTNQDRDTAKLAVGQTADLALDPMGLVDGVDQNLEMGPDGRPPLESIEDYAATIFAVQRTLRQQLNCSWIVFIDRP